MVKINSLNNNFLLYNPDSRKPKGIGISPYSLHSLIRYILNFLFDGYFSYINPDHRNMKLLGKEGRIKRCDASECPSSLKIVFLGDIMLSRSGNPPQIENDLKKILATADVIVANIESPVISSDQILQRGYSLQFMMPNSFLSTLYSCNRAAKWVFSIANNHACDHSEKNELDVSGVITTIDSIRAFIPDAEIIGAEIGSAKSVLSLQVEQGPQIGFVAWTELMNHDRHHYKKKIMRETDITEEVVGNLKDHHDLLFGFAHGNEEQSYYPLKETRDRWSRLIDKKKFDAIVGHGPHVLHPAERIGEEGLLFHSIGNFCSSEGKSQTKVGCIPEITIDYKNNQILSTQYKVHLLRQRGESLSIIEDLNGKNPIYPRIMHRLKNIWKTLGDG